MARPAVLEQDPGAWLADAIDYLVSHAAKTGSVTADDLRRDMPAPHHHNAVGTAFRIASARDLIIKTTPLTSTARSRRHGTAFTWNLHPSQRSTR